MELGGPLVAACRSRRQAVFGEGLREQTRGWTLTDDQHPGGGSAVCGFLRSHREVR